LTWISFSRKA